MKRTALALTLILVLSGLISGLSFTEVVTASLYPATYKPPAVTVSSPSPGRTYNVTVIPLIVTIQLFGYKYYSAMNQSIETISWLNYSLDGQTAIPITPTYPHVLGPGGYYVDGRSTLSGLSDGRHILVIQGKTTFNTVIDNKFSFNVDTVIPTISVMSPENKTYITSDVLLNFTLDERASWVGYSLDKRENVAIEGNTILYNVSYGVHNLIVYANDTAGNFGFKTVYFTIADIIAPSVSILSPENKIYDTGRIPLSFTVNESISQMAYSLDGQENVTISGNTTLTELANGAHTLTIYAWDETGNVGSETMRFTVNVPFPTLVIAASEASIAAIGAGLFVYFKKRKR